MSQVDRTRKSRNLNRALGLVPTTLIVPEDELERYKTEAAYSRADHMMQIVNGDSNEKIKLLARKRSPWNHTAENRAALEAIDDPDDREAAAKLLAEYRELEDEINHGDYTEDSLFKLDKMSAKKVAIGHKLMYLIGEE